VRRRRGGWCYEMNGLLGWALDELGFRVTRATGAVMRELAGDAMAGNHLVLKVELDEGVYLADVGFGDGPLEPIQVTAGPFSDGRFEFALSRADGEWWRFHNHPAGGAKSFDFRLAPANESLFAEKCAFLQTSETSPFVQNLVCQRHTKEGLSILRGRVLKTLTPQGASERLLESERDLVAVLGDTFALHVPEAPTLWPKICSRHEALFAAAQSLENRTDN
jgi:N-hydroxyarylamine O-acetyltransferase